MGWHIRRLKSGTDEEVRILTATGDRLVEMAENWFTYTGGEGEPMFLDFLRGNLEETKGSMLVTLLNEDSGALQEFEMRWEDEL